MTTSTLSPSILIVDDDSDVRFMLASLLNSEGFTCLEAENGNKALAIVRENRTDLALLDLTLPGKSGLDILREIRKTHRSFPVIMITGWGTQAVAEMAGSLHVNGFLTKPFRNNEVVLSIRMALSGSNCSRNTILPTCDPASIPIEDLFGQSPTAQNIVKQATLVAPTNFTVVISGETGVGKDYLAHAIHRLSNQSEGPFIPVDSGAIPESLMESALFGHEKGSFTGADRQRIGCFEAASQGTLFLDEIGNLSLAMQARFLRALQERTIYRIGSNNPIPFNARILVATNENLKSMVASGKFRQDLYFRINEFSITIPPLRDRKEDMLYLTSRFIEWTNQELNKCIKGLSNDALRMILEYPWPGNVRELRNLVRRAILEAVDTILPENLKQAGLPELIEPTCNLSSSLAVMKTRMSLPLRFESEQYNNSCQIIGSVMKLFAENPNGLELLQTMDLRSMLAHCEADVQKFIIELTHGNIKAAARIMQIDYKTLRAKAKVLNHSHSHDKDL